MNARISSRLPAVPTSLHSMATRGRPTGIPPATRIPIPTLRGTIDMSISWEAALRPANWMPFQISHFLRRPQAETNHAGMVTPRGGCWRAAALDETTIGIAGMDDCPVRPLQPDAEPASRNPRARLVITNSSKMRPAPDACSQQQPPLLIGTT